MRYNRTMDDRTKTLAAISLIAGAAICVVIILFVSLTGRKTLSPIPDEGAIRIVFISPTLVPVFQPSPTASPTATPKQKR